MIELFHGGSHGHSASVLITLAEKGLPFEGHELDLAAFAHHDPAFLAINPHGQVPALRDEERVLTETFFMLLYLDDKHPDPPLGGANPRARYGVQKWGKYVETHIAPNLAILDWAMRGAIPGDQMRDGLSCLTQERQALWHQALEGFSSEDVRSAREALVKAAYRMAEELDGSPWLAGDHWSLADIMVFPQAAKFASLMIDLPASVADWLHRASERPAVRQALGTAGIVPTAAMMGPERGRWG